MESFDASKKKNRLEWEMSPKSCPEHLDAAIYTAPLSARNASSGFVCHPSDEHVTKPWLLTSSSSSSSSCPHEKLRGSGRVGMRFTRKLLTMIYTFFPRLRVCHACLHVSVTSSQYHMISQTLNSRDMMGRWHVAWWQMSCSCRGCFVIIEVIREHEKHEVGVLRGFLKSDAIGWSVTIAVTVINFATPFYRRRRHCRHRTPNNGREYNGEMHHHDGHDGRDGHSPSNVILLKYSHTSGMTDLVQ